MDEKRSRFLTQLNEQKTISCLEQEYYRKIAFAFPTIFENNIYAFSLF